MLAGRSTTAMLPAKNGGSPSGSPKTKISGHDNSSASDLDKDRWVSPDSTSRSRSRAISKFIFVVFTTAILSSLCNKLLVKL